MHLQRFFKNREKLWTRISTDAAILAGPDRQARAASAYMIDGIRQELVARRATVFVEVILAGQSGELLAACERKVALIPEVLKCHLMAGTADYLLKVVARDTEDFARIHRRYLARLPGVAQMHSSFALRTVVSTRTLPLD